MIEINQETLIPLTEVPERLPPRPSGRQVHRSDICRVRLEEICVEHSLTGDHYMLLMTRRE